MMRAEPVTWEWYNAKFPSRERRSHSRNAGTISSQPWENFSQVVYHVPQSPFLDPIKPENLVTMSRRWGSWLTLRCFAFRSSAAVQLLCASVSSHHRHAACLSTAPSLVLVMSLCGEPNRVLNLLPRLGACPTPSIGPCLACCSRPLYLQDATAIGRESPVTVCLIASSLLQTGCP